MALTQFTCPSTAPTSGESHEFEYCVNSCKSRCLSPYLLAALARSSQNNHHKGKYISATSLSGCTRKLFSERTFEYSMEPKKVLYGYRGTVMHTVIEDATEWNGFNDKSLVDFGFLSEWSMKVGFCFEHGGFPLPEGVDASDTSTWAQVECPGCFELEIDPNKQEWFVLGGTLDGAEPLWEGREDGVPAFDPETGVLWMVLHDLKTMREGYATDGFIMGSKFANLHTHTKDDHVIQANIYKYLAERSFTPENLRKLGVTTIKFCEARLQGFAMGEFPYMGSTYLYKPPKTRGEPKSYAIPVIKFFEDAWTEAFIKQNGRGVYESLITGKNMGPVCAPEKSSQGSYSWKCDFCAFTDSDVCPDPATEWEAISKGASPKKAFRAAKKVREARLAEPL